MIHDWGDGVVAIDSVMHGRRGVTGVFYLPGPHPALVEAGPATSLDRVLEGLEEAGAGDLEWIVLTHVHLDHAGAAGHLAERYPRARIAVRAEGAPHLADPSRLWASAARLYDDMEGLWGSMRPVPGERIHAVAADGLLADLGDGRVLESVHTPGHARHHMAILDRSRGRLFAGDALGVFLPEAGAIRPATPPPEFHLEECLRSIERLAAVGAESVILTHFGPLPDPARGFGEAAERIRRWVALAEEVVRAGGDVPEVAAAFRDSAPFDFPGIDPEVAERMASATSDELNAAGIVRYLKKFRGLQA